MIITCGQCQAKFKVAPEQIKETGSKVRCSNCQYVFTVYRPKRTAEPVPPADDYDGGTGLDDYRSSPASDRNTGREPDDFYGGREDDPGRSGFADGGYDEDDYLDDDRPADDPASMKERRDRRRRLYSDLEESSDDYGPDDDPLSEDYGDDPDMDDGLGSVPPLRRNRSRLSSMAGERETEDYGDDFEETPEDFDPEDIRDDEPAGANLGLGADPVEPAAADAGNKPDPFARLAAGYHADKGGGLGAALAKTSKKSRLLAALALVAVLLAVGIYFLTNRPAGDSLIDGVATVEDGDGERNSAEDSVRSPEDPNGTMLIGFTEGAQNYFYFKNAHAGNILVLTGRVRNNYSEPRSFIKLRGHLLSSDERTLADRFAFAGNILSEEDLKSLPINEISNRLMIKGGQDNMNMNIAPGGEIPFMMVFDNVPDGTDQYRIDAVGSDPAQ